MKKNDPDLDKHRRQEKANAYLRELKKKGVKRVRRCDWELQMDDTTNKVTEDLTTNMYGTTQDDTDAAQASNVMVQEVDMTTVMTPAMTSNYDQPFIKDFLAKPILVENFEHTAGDTLFKEYRLESYLHANNAVRDIWWDKVKGFYGIKGTFVFRLNVNAQPFQAGRLLVTYEPMYYDMVFSDGTSSAFDRTSSLVTATQLHRTELDLATQSELVLNIPYNSLAGAYNLLDGTGTWGRVVLQEYLPLNVSSTAQNTINVSVFLSLEDVEMTAPTLPDTIYPQFETQAGDEEKKVGPFEKGMALTSKVAMLGSTIPYVQTVAKPLAWVSSIGEKVCSIFGWSKPQNTMAIQRFNNTLMQYQANNGGLDNAFNLGLAIDNEVECQPGFGGTFLDESSLGFVKTRSALFRTYNWPGSAASGDLLLGDGFESSIQLKPTEFQQTFDGINFAMTPIAGLANVFHNWRGGLRFKFKFAKTQYHSGRLAVSFLPANLNTLVGADTTPFPVDLNTSTFLHREILDLRKAFEFEFTVLYTANVPYLNVEQPMGRMVIHVLNPLIGTEIVADDIQFAVEVSGAEDFEFFGPREPIYYPTEITRLPIVSGSTLKELLDNNSISGFEIVSENIVTDTYTIKVAFVDSRPSELIEDIPIFSRIEGEAVVFAPGTKVTSLITRTVQQYSDATANLANVGLYAYDTAFPAQDVFMVYTDQQRNIIIQNLILGTPPPFELQSGGDSDIRTDRTIGAMKGTGPLNTKMASSCVGEQILSLKQLALRTVYNTPLETELFQQGDVIQSIVQRPHVVSQRRQNGLDIGLHDYYSYVASCFAFARGGTIMRFQTNQFKRAELVFDDSRALINIDTDQNGFTGYNVEKSGNIIAVYCPQYANTIGRLVTRSKGNDIGCGRPFGHTTRVLFSGLVTAGADENTELRIGRSAADDTQFGFFLGFPPMKRFIRKE